jgi:hypothetical protein
MTKNSIVKLTITVLSLIIFSSVGVSAQKKKNCPAMTDAEIIKRIYDEMKKKPDYDGQILHVNVVSLDGVVTLQGWAKNSKTKKGIEKIAKKIKCVTVVNQLADGPVGCGPGQKRCGDICIGTEETCSICTAKTCL